MDQGSNVFSGYKPSITEGHDEYWSASVRANFDKFVAAGGNAAIFSGNTMWRKVDNTADAFGRNG